MTEDYVSFEIAKLLKEKGFDEICEMFYKNPINGYMKNMRVDMWTNSNLRKDMVCTCPTLQMAMKWLRENYEIFIQPNMLFCYPIQYFATIFCYGDNLKTQQDVETERFDTYEEACEAAIKYCLENLI